MAMKYSSLFPVANTSSGIFKFHEFSHDITWKEKPKTLCVCVCVCVRGGKMGKEGERGGERERRVEGEDYSLSRSSDLNLTHCDIIIFYVLLTC